MKPGRKPQHERNLRMYQTLLAEGRTRGQVAVGRARELLETEFNVHLSADDAQIRRIIADGRRRHESGWVPPKVPFHQGLASWLKKLYILTTVFHWLGRGLSLRQACRRAHKQLGIPETEIIATYKPVSRYLSEHSLTAQRQDLIKLAAQATLPWMS